MFNFIYKPYLERVVFLKETELFSSIKELILFYIKENINDSIPKQHILCKLEHVYRNFYKIVKIYNEKEYVPIYKKLTMLK